MFFCQNHNICLTWPRQLFFMHNYVPITINTQLDNVDCVQPWFVTYCHSRWSLVVLYISLAHIWSSPSGHCLAACTVTSSCLSEPSTSQSCYCTRCVRRGMGTCSVIDTQTPATWRQTMTTRIKQDTHTHL